MRQRTDARASTAYALPFPTFQDAMTHTESPLWRDFHDLAPNVGENARATARGTGASVRENPWPMMRACAALGIALGPVPAQRRPPHCNGA